MSDDKSNNEEAPAAHPLITELATMEQQVGRHVIEALRQDEVVAVLTTVLPRQDGQNIVSVGLDEDMLENVRDVLAKSDADELPRVPCIGFHCFAPSDAEKKGEEKP